MKKNNRTRPAVGKCRSCGEKFDRGTNAKQQAANHCSRACANRIRPITHGESRTPTWQAWVALIQRCENPNGARYPIYGGRGIKVCARWRRSFAAFLADVGERPNAITTRPKHGGPARRAHWSLDRFPDANGDYKPGNVRWATHDMQAQNRRTTILTIDAARSIRSLHAGGAKRRAIAEKFGVSRDTISDVVANRTWRNA